MRTKISKVALRANDSFMNLVREFPLRPIRSIEQYDAAADILDRLALRDEDSLNAGEADYLETLELLIEAYDDIRFVVPADKSKPLDRLKYLMDRHAMGPAELGDLIGSRPTATLILQGARELSKAHIRKLADRFKVDAGYFL